MKNMRRACAALVGLSLLAMLAMGCNNSELDNKVDESKLPPKPTDGRGPQSSGASGAPAAPTGAKPAGAAN